MAVISFSSSCVSESSSCVSVRMFEKSCARVDLMEAASYPFIRHTSQTRERLNDADNSLYTSRKRYLKGKGKRLPSECSSCRLIPLCVQRTPFPSTPPYTTLTIKLRNYFSQGRLNALFRFLHGCELSYNDSASSIPTIICGITLHISD